MPGQTTAASIFPLKAYHSFMPIYQPPAFTSSNMLTTLSWKDSSLPSGSRPSHGKSQPVRPSLSSLLRRMLTSVQTAMAHVPRSVAVHVVGTTTTPNYTYAVQSSTVYDPSRRNSTISPSQNTRYTPALTTAVVMEHTISTSTWANTDRKVNDGNYRILPNTYVADAFVYERSIDSRSDTLTSYSSDSERDASLGGKTSSRGSSNRDACSKRKSALLAITNHSHNRDSILLPQSSPPHPNTPTAAKSGFNLSRSPVDNRRREDYASDGSEGSVQAHPSNLSPTRTSAHNGLQSTVGSLAVTTHNSVSSPTHDDVRAGHSRARTNSVLMSSSSSRSNSSSPTERVGKAVEVRRDRSSSGSSSSSHHDRMVACREEPRHTSPPRDSPKDVPAAPIPPRSTPLNSVPINRLPPARRVSNIIINTNVDNPITSRTVRFSENLICPSPILPSRRRQGWYNKRGLVHFLDC